MHHKCTILRHIRVGSIHASPFQYALVLCTCSVIVVI
jgi:hypothetical protein